MTSKACSDCARFLDSSAFGANAATPDGRSYYCFDCARARSHLAYRKRVAATGRLARSRPRRDPTAAARACPDCGEVKPLSDFPVVKKSRDGRGTYCKPCHNARGRASRERAGGAREYHLRRRYGIGVAEFDAMVAEQGGVCALCRERAPQHVDHHHLTGVIRGVLCSGCNQGLGNFRDSADAMRRAIDYLERTTCQRSQEAPGVYRLTSPPRRAASPSSSALQLLISSRRA